MKLMAARQQIVDYGLKMLTSGLTTGSGGNLSILDAESDLIAIGPSGIDYTDVSVDDVVIVDRQGDIVEGKWKPSSELSFHLALYRQRPEITAVVHTHSVYATTIACLNWEIPAVHYLVAFSGDKVPLAPYATFGSEELATSVGDHIGTYNALLLANHGLVAIGADMNSAFNVAEEIELVARIYYQAKSIGKPVLVEADEMKRVGEKFASYGQQDDASSSGPQ
ncbi:MAG: fuculose phosphate aldolase [Desulfuromonadales bacterium C00003068]|jgi:L-fuculose-phosphate aldolase|nr:MAG: fuculose phosphate aldolase [Desulfuromonadales bacterium C00003068]